MMDEGRVEEMKKKTHIREANTADVLSLDSLKERLKMHVHVGQ